MPKLGYNYNISLSLTQTMGGIAYIDQIAVGLETGRDESSNFIHIFIA